MNKRPEFNQRQKMKKRTTFIQKKSLKKRPRRTRKSLSPPPPSLKEIGSDLVKKTENQRVYDDGELVYRSISYVPDLYKIFKVIFVEAADSIKRSNPIMDCLKVNIDPVKNTVSIYYNGRVLPLTHTHWEERVADATMLTEKRFCTEFVIEIADGSRLEKRKQVFTRIGKSKPKITKCEAREDWTRLTFKPNLRKFNMAHLEADVVALMKKCVLDMAESLKQTVDVELNDRLVRIVESFEDYALLCKKFAKNSGPVNPIELALSEEKAKDRYTWNRNFESGKELILFSRADPERSIPSLVDGLKPDQRKVLSCAFERNLYEEINVAHFVSHVSEHFACHNGEESLGCTIIEMAQDFVGSNNINLFIPNGHFGTRNFGGEDHRSARFIYTKLNPLTRCIFHEKFLDHLNKDKDWTKWYIPIIPLVLVNGTRGIGAGWTSIPSYDPLDIVTNVKHWLLGEKMESMVPFYRGFGGTVDKKLDSAEYEVSGRGEIVEIDGQHNFEITELPIGMQTVDYLRFLESIAGWNEKVKDPLIEDWTCKWKDDAKVDIKIRIKPDKIALLKKLPPKELYEKFKLISTVSTNNMHLFDSEGKIKKFDNPEKILEEFCLLGLSYYENQKVKKVMYLQKRIRMLKNRARFIKENLEDPFYDKHSGKGLIDELKRRHYAAFMPRKGKWGGFEYLIQIPPMMFFIKGIVKKLLAKKKEKTAELEALKKKTPAEMWLMDLFELEKKIKEERESSSQAGKTAKTQKPENTSMEVDNVVVVNEVAKPKGRAGSTKTQKDDKTRLQVCLDAHYKSSPYIEKAGGMEEIKFIKNNIISFLLEKKKRGLILDTELETEAVRTAESYGIWSSASEDSGSSDSGSSASEDSGSSASEDSESETEGQKVNHIPESESDHNDYGSIADNDDSDSIADTEDSDDSDDSDDSYYTPVFNDSDSDFDSDD